MFELTSYNEKYNAMQIAPTFSVLIDKPTRGGYRRGSGRKTIAITLADIENRPMCSCGFNKVSTSRHMLHGESKIYIRKYCHTCSDRLYKRNSRTFCVPKDICAKCGFKPNLDCQMDFDHIDGNPTNNDLSNIQVLCANCHREKSYVNRDNSNLKYRKGVDSKDHTIN